MYRAPGSSRTLFMHKFGEMCSEITTNNMPLLILGDFNLAVLKEEASVEQMETASNCKQIVKETVQLCMALTWIWSLQIILQQMFGMYHLLIQTIVSYI